VRGVVPVAAVVACAVVACAAVAALPATAAAQEAEPSIPPEHQAQADRAQEMVDRLEAGDKSGGALSAARVLREECLATGNHRSAEFLAGRIVASFPDQLRDEHRFVDILLVRGKRERAERELRQHLVERPTDCAAYAALSDLLLEVGRPADAMAVHALHLKEHADESGPLRARASIALWEMRDVPLARTCVADLRRAADVPGVRGSVSAWLRARADEVEAGATKREKDGAILRASSSRLDRVLWSTALAGAIAIALGGWLTRPRAS